MQRISQVLKQQRPSASLGPSARVPMFMYGLMQMRWMHSGQARRRSPHAGGSGARTWSNHVLPAPPSTNQLTLQIIHWGGCLPRVIVMSTLPAPNLPPPHPGLHLRCSVTLPSLITPQWSPVLPFYQTLAFGTSWWWCSDVTSIVTWWVLSGWKVVPEKEKQIFQKVELKKYRDCCWGGKKWHCLI